VIHSLQRLQIYKKKLNEIASDYNQLIKTPPLDISINNDNEELNELVSLQVPDENEQLKENRKKRKRKR